MCLKVCMHLAYSPGFMMLQLRCTITQARGVTVKSGSNWLPYISGTCFGQRYQIACKTREGALLLQTLLWSDVMRRLEESQ